MERGGVDWRSSSGADLLARMKCGDNKTRSGNDLFDDALTVHKCRGLIGDSPAKYRLRLARRFSASGF
jgi:hypothetical protein